MALPVAVEPVNETMSTRGSFVMSSPIPFCEEVMTFTTPGGRSVFSRRNRPSRRLHQGVTGAPLSTTVQPAASAQPTFFRLSSWGKFQAVMAPTTPTGSRSSQRCALLPIASPMPRSSVHSYFSRKSA